MPNHVTNIVEANPVVINAILNDDGVVDFKVINPMPDDLSINGASGFYGDAETAAKLMCREKLSESHFFARLEASNRREANALNMTDESFEQFVCMMRNKRKHGFTIAWTSLEMYGEQNGELITPLKNQTIKSHLKPHGLIHSLH